MTKFEEEAIKEAEKCGYVMAKSKIVFYEDEKGITFVDFNGTHTNFNFPWLEFAKNWHSDEEFQAEKDARKKEYEIHQDIYSKTSKKLNEAELEIANLKSQLQQQALPVVPECVAEYIERCKRSDCGLIWAIRPDRDANDNSEKVYDWLFPNGVKLPNGMYPNPYEPDNLVRPDKENQIKFVRAWLDGYQVEKPQLFYLKNKLTRKYLRKSKHTKDDWNEDIDRVETVNNKTKFTQQEIDSMQTGSYEQIEVEK